MPQDWTPIENQQIETLKTLFAGDPNRAEKFTRIACGIRFDFSKTHVTESLISQFETLAAQADLAVMRHRLFAGEVVNPTEDRAASHTAERGEGDVDTVKISKLFHGRMRALIDAIEMGALGEIRHILHIGIGGSALGPDLIIDALGRDAGRYDVAVVSNVDGSALAEAFAKFDPNYTLVAVASKTFTTTETLLNATSALEWMEEAGVEDAIGRFVALTASPEKAVEWGIDETRVLPFAVTVGGRYSLWSSIGFPAALALGWDVFESLLEGAAEMDRHFRLTDWRDNVCFMAAASDLYYTQVRHCETRAVFAYDERLRLLPSYLQQLEMESNGKGVTAEGKPLGRASAPITWGGVGTDAQHAVFQLLHQGTHLVPVEFVASKTPGSDLDPAHHRTLLINCFAQGAALMAGRDNDDGARYYPGDRPSTTILLEDVDARSVGALIAFYEHRVFVDAVLLGINPFDQFGVELGKEIAKSIESEGTDKFDPSTKALIAAAFE